MIRFRTCCVASCGVLGAEVGAILRAFSADIIISYDRHSIMLASSAMATERLPPGFEEQKAASAGEGDRCLSLNSIIPDCLALSPSHLVTTPPGRLHACRCTISDGDVLSSKWSMPSVLSSSKRSIPQALYQRSGILLHRTTSSSVAALKHARLRMSCIYALTIIDTCPGLKRKVGTRSDLTRAQSLTSDLAQAFPTSSVGGAV